MAFAPDGRSMAVHTESATILYDTASGRPIRRFEEKSQVHEGNAQPFSLAFSPDGSMLAASFFDAPIVLWEVGTGRRIRSFGADSKGLSNLAFTPDGKAWSRPCPIRWTGVPGRECVGPEQSLIRSGTSRRAGDSADRAGEDAIGEMALAPDGKTLAVATTGREDRDPQGKSLRRDGRPAHPALGAGHGARNPPVRRGAT